MLQLLATRLFYEAAVSSLQTAAWKTSPDSLAQKIQTLAKLSFKHFPGVLADPRIENLLTKIGRVLPEPSSERTEYRDGTNSRRVLHIASTVASTGGHTRVLLDWITLDNNSSPSLLLTNQSTPLPQIVEERLGKTQTEPIVLDHLLSPTERASQLRQIILDGNYDLIVLHIHPEDVIPIMALAVERGIPPVLFFNHADFSFNLGHSVADLVVDYREVAQKFSLDHRFFRSATTLQFPMDDAPNIVKHDAKNKIGVNTNTTVLFSMASMYKYTPYKGFNFFEFYSRLLRKFPNCTMFIAGVSPEQATLIHPDPLPSNLIPLGLLPNPTYYCAAADYFVQPIPLRTGLAAFDAARYGAVPIFGFCDLSVYADTVGEFPKELAAYAPSSLQEYTDLLERELTTGEIKERLSDQFTAFIENCRPPKWNQRLETIYRLALSAPHQCLDTNRLPKMLIHRASRRYNKLKADPWELWGNIISQFDLSLVRSRLYLTLGALLLFATAPRKTLRALLRSTAMLLLGQDTTRQYILHLKQILYGTK